MIPPTAMELALKTSRKSSVSGVKSCDVCPIALRCIALAMFKGNGLASRKASLYIKLHVNYAPVWDDSFVNGNLRRLKNQSVPASVTWSPSAVLNSVSEGIPG
jgi:hypothetical protein